jgi:predicted MFS family arabinose efflux permease
MFLTDVGAGMALPSLSAAAVARLAPNRFGVGSTVNQAVRQIGAALGVAIAVALVGRAAPTLADFKSLFLVQIGLMLLTALLCAPVHTRPRHAPAPAAARLRLAPALEG